MPVRPEPDRSEFVEYVDSQDRVLGVVERAEAVRRGWRHRVAGVICRGAHGRYLVHQRSMNIPWFAGWYAALIGGAVRPGESHTEAAARETTEELGIHVPVRYLFKFICDGAVGQYWLGIHEALITEEIVPDAQEIAWFTWLTQTELQQALAEPGNRARGQAREKASEEVWP